VRIWSTTEDKHLTAFKHHRDTVSSLSFRKHGGGNRDAPDEAATTSTSSPSNQLYSASHDRTIKLWNVDELSYIETLFGHQDSISGIDALAKEHCLTSGSRDRTVRLWKIIEESQLIFRAGGGVSLTEEAVVMDGMRPKADKRADVCGSVDVVCMLDEETFVSGSDSGALSLWTLHRKKPLFTRPHAHGPRGPMPVVAGEGASPAAPLPPVDPGVAECTWITALAAQPFTDLFASGSCDGAVRLWKLAEHKKSFALLNVIPMVGFVNQLAFFEAPPSDDLPDAARRLVTGGRGDVLHLAAAIGQEHKFGRWWKCKGAKNGVKLITLG
jgi:ribosomal RNA-processing protein 9